MKMIKQQYTIHAPVAEVWQALVDPNLINAWGAGKATMSAKKGEKFSLWSGEIFGTNLEVIPEQKLVQEWQEKSWDGGPSLVTITLHKKDEDTTLVELLHEKVPDSEVEDIAHGWKAYYMGPLKNLVER